MRAAYSAPGSSTRCRGASYATCRWKPSTTRSGTCASNCWMKPTPSSPTRAAASSGANVLASVMRVQADDTAPLREFYLKEMRAFVQAPALIRPLADPTIAAAHFATLRPLLPPALEGAIADLESICEEERQLMRQERMHRLLHGWLVVHVPLSFALMALAVVHMVMALRF